MRASRYRWRDRAAVLSLCSTLAACVGPAVAETKAGAGAAAAAVVRTEPVGRGPTLRPIVAPGTLYAKHQLDLSFKVGGVLRQVRVDKGAAVKKGQVLAALDATELAAAVRQARESLAKARRDLDRAARLTGSGTLPRSNEEDAHTAAAVAEASLTTAEFNAAQAVIVAPQDGWVEEKLAEPGEIVTPGRPILHMSGLESGWVLRVAVADRDVVRLAAGDRARVALDALPSHALDGAVSQIARGASRGTGTYEVEVRVAPPSDVTLLAGLTGKARFEKEARGVVTVAASALVDADERAGAVFAVDGDRARRVPVRVAFLTAGRAALEGDLAGVDRVVTEGAAGLVDGALLRALPSTEASGR